MYMNTSYGIQLYMAHSLCFYLPLLVFPFFPFSSPLLTWNPPSCDRNRPPQFQVARKLTPPVPHLAPCTPPSKIPTPFGFSRSHVHLIRATLQPIPLWSRTVIHHLASWFAFIHPVDYFQFTYVSVLFTLLHSIISCSIIHCYFLFDTGNVFQVFKSP
jgi:hypothetical protein